PCCGEQCPESGQGDFQCGDGQGHVRLQPARVDITLKRWNYGSSNRCKVNRLNQLPCMGHAPQFLDLSSEPEHVVLSPIDHRRDFGVEEVAQHRELSGRLSWPATC